MNDADVGKQVQQMVRFILQEADEKASEITVAAEEVRAAYSPSIVFKSQIANLVLHPFSIHFLFFMIIKLMIVWTACICMQEFNIEKLQLVESEKRRVRQEYERKEKQVDVRRKM